MLETQYVSFLRSYLRHSTHFFRERNDLACAVCGKVVKKYNFLSTRTISAYF